MKSDCKVFFITQNKQEQEREGPGRNDTWNVLKTQQWNRSGYKLQGTVWESQAVPLRWLMVAAESSCSDGEWAASSENRERPGRDTARRLPVCLVEWYYMLRWASSHSVQTSSKSFMQPSFPHILGVWVRVTTDGKQEWGTLVSQFFMSWFRFSWRTIWVLVKHRLCVRGYGPVVDINNSWGQKHQQTNNQAD